MFYILNEKKTFYKCSKLINIGNTSTILSGLAYEIYSGGGPSTYVYCVVCYRVIVRSVCHVFAYLYTLDDDSERPMDYETSLLPNVFPLTQLQWIGSYCLGKMLYFLL